MIKLISKYLKGNPILKWYYGDPSEVAVTLSMGQIPTKLGIVQDDYKKPEYVQLRNALKKVAPFGLGASLGGVYGGAYNAADITNEVLGGFTYPLASFLSSSLDTKRLDRVAKNHGNGALYRTLFLDPLGLSLDEKVNKKK